MIDAFKTRPAAESIEEYEQIVARARGVTVEELHDRLGLFGAICDHRDDLPEDGGCEGFVMLRRPTSTNPEAGGESAASPG